MMRGILMKLTVLINVLSAFGHFEVELEPIYCREGNLQQYSGYTMKLKIGGDDYRLLLSTKIPITWIPNHIYQKRHGKKIPGKLEIRVFSDSTVTFFQRSDNIELQTTEGKSLKCSSFSFGSMISLLWLEWFKYHKMDVDGVFGISSLEKPESEASESECSGKSGKGRAKCLAHIAQFIKSPAHKPLPNPLMDIIRENKLDPIFTITPNASSHQARLTIGGWGPESLCDLSNSIAEEIVYDTELRRGADYSFEFSSIKVNNFEKKNSERENLLAYLDTAKSYIGVPAGLMPKLARELKATFDLRTKRYKVSCSTSISFEIFTKSGSYRINTRNLIIKTRNSGGSQCYLAIVASITKGFTLGMPFWSDRCVTFDPLNRKIHLALMKT